MRKKFVLSLFIAFFFASAMHQAVLAQNDDYRINLRRDFGYGNGMDIRGTFSIRLVGDETLVEQVIFLIDKQPIGTVNDAPYRLQFHTDDYDLGLHSLIAEVTLQDGTTLQTESIQANFVSADQEGKFVTTVLVGIFGAIAVSFIIMAIIQTVVFKKKKGENGPQKKNYGLLGGTICPKCGIAFPRHLWGINLFVGRLDRCDHCGKWVMTTRATPAALRTAEDLDQSGTQPDKVEIPPEKTLEQRLDESKFIDS